ncbi:hypothetical protein TUMEXPCC7403_13345 [Tumidithrix helvetica PCC 7403]|uniref:eCIS core domain-containing protein n=1 Tax=Tumidithrix helvetica TaxID=3457545 RepID=UPI003C97722C
MSEYTNKPATDSSFAPPAVQIQTRPFAPPQVQPSAAPQNAESSQAERDLAENKDKQSSQENLYFTNLSFSGNDNRGSTESVMQRKWEGIVQRYKEGGNAAPDPNHGYTPVRGSSQSIMQRKLDEMRQRVKEGGNVAPDPNYEYTPVRGSSQSIMQRKHQEMVQRYKENQAKTIQAKLAIGAVGDKYEQEADRVAAEVVQKINAPESIHRQENEDELQMKPLFESIQRDVVDIPEDEDELQMKPLFESIQRDVVDIPEDEDELQMKPLFESIQRDVVDIPEDEDELQMKPLFESIQRDVVDIPEDEDELQMKPTLQLRSTLGGDTSEDLERSIQSVRGSGQSLEPNLQARMGQAMGADFRSVRVHTDTQSNQLNQLIQARAFTTGQDVFFRQGEYNPGSRGGQELIAHELTHVVQQRAVPTASSMVRRWRTTDGTDVGDGVKGITEKSHSDGQRVILQETKGNTLQRKVIVDGERYRPSYLRAAGWPEYKVTMVRVWDNSDVEHKFESLTTLDEWLDVSKTKLMGNVPNLYTLPNFKFTTEESGRLPSLYFIKSTSEHGRIRQQHSQGPVIDELGGTKQDYFITNSKPYDEFMDKVYKVTQGWKHSLSDRSSEIVREKFNKFGASTEPSDGKNHLEVKPASGAITWIHESGGVVKLPNNHPEYDDMTIRKIYLDTTGRED